MSLLDSGDPFYTGVVQPLVDRMGLDPKAAARQMTIAFLGLAIASAVVRVATGGPNGGAFDQTLHVIGAAIVSWWINWCTRWGDISRIGHSGILHLALRVMLMLCALVDLTTLCWFATLDFHVDAIVWLRQSMQTAENVAGGMALYLGMCRKPPPRRGNPRPLTT